jgi:hypothetical protein
MPSLNSQVPWAPDFSDSPVWEGVKSREAVGLLVLFVPSEVEPAQAVEDGIDGGFGVAGDVGVVDAQDHGAAVVAGVEPVEDIGPRAPNVQKASGRRGETNSDHGNFSITSSLCSR